MIIVETRSRGTKHFVIMKHLIRGKLNINATSERLIFASFDQMNYAKSSLWQSFLYLQGQFFEQLWLSLLGSLEESEILVEVSHKSYFRVIITKGEVSVLGCRISGKTNHHVQTGAV